MAAIPQDDDVRRLLSTPAQVGDELVWVGELCVRRCRDRLRLRCPAWQTQLRLRQRLETARLRRSAPGWLPAELDRYVAYAEFRGGGELVGLARDRRRGLTAATWFERECLAWRPVTADSPVALGTLRVELTQHCVQRYARRIALTAELAQAREELQRLVVRGRVLPEVPVWFDGHTMGGTPCYWLAVGDWLLLPLQPSASPRRDVLAAVTCLYRGMPVAPDALRGAQLQLHTAGLQLHRRALLELPAAGQAA